MSNFNNSERVGMQLKSYRLEELVEPYPGAWGEESPTNNTMATLVIGTGNISNEGGLEINGATVRHLTKSEQTAIAYEGDLLVVKSSGSASNIRSGKTGLCPRELSGKIACSNFMYRLAVRKELADPFLLWLFLNSPQAKGYVKLVVGSSTYPNLKWETYKNLPLRLPNLKEQQTIALELKFQLALVDEARNAAQAQMKEINRLKTQALNKIFANIEGTCQIGEVAKVQSGYAFKSQTFQKQGVRLLRNANILPGKVYWDDPVFMSPNDAQSYLSYELIEGDVLISLDRPIISTGLKVARVTATDLPALLVQRVGRFLLDKKRLNPDYLYAFLQTHIFIDSISGHDQSLGVPHISPGQIEAIEIPLPDLDVQKALAEILIDIAADTHEAQHAAHAQLKDIELLPSRLLAAAFNETEYA